MVFTSPEALTRTLGRVLEQVAASGHLGHFVVDEAHMVAAWGGEFRPDYQVWRRLPTQAPRPRPARAGIGSHGHHDGD